MWLGLLVDHCVDQVLGKCSFGGVVRAGSLAHYWLPDIGCKTHAHAHAEDARVRCPEMVHTCVCVLMNVVSVKPEVPASASCRVGTTVMVSMWDEAHAICGTKHVSKC